MRKKEERFGKGGGDRGRDVTGLRVVGLSVVNVTVRMDKLGLFTRQDAGMEEPAFNLNVTMEKKQICI